MRNLLLAFLLIPLWSNAQDRIITTQGDTLIGKIKLVGEESLKFRFQGESQTKIISKSIVAQFDKKYRETLSDSSLTKFEQRKKYDGFSIAVWNGIGHLIYPIYETVPVFLVKYNNRLQTGYTFATELSYFFNKHLGVGSRYSVMMTNSSFDNILFYDSDGNYLGISDMRDQVRIHSAGINLIGRLINKKQTIQLTGSFFLGYTHFRDKVKSLVPFVVTSHMVGVGGKLAGDFRAAKNFYFGLSAGTYYANVSRYKYQDENVELQLSLDKENHLNLLRIEVLFGIRFDF